MTIGNENPVINRHQAKKKKDAAMAAAFPQGIRCQKCLGYGHWSYECKAKRKHLVRPSRTQILKQNLKQKDDGCSSGSCKSSKKKTKLSKDCSGCSTKSGPDSDTSSSSDSSSSDSNDSSDSDSDTSSTDSKSNSSADSDY